MTLLFNSIERCWKMTRKWWRAAGDSLRETPGRTDTDKSKRDYPTQFRARASLS